MTISQSVLEDFLRRASADNGVTVDLTGFVIDVTDPPFTVPSGIRLTGAYTLRVPAETYPAYRGATLRYRLPDVTAGPGGAHVSFSGQQLRISTGPGGAITPNGITRVTVEDIHPDGTGGLVAEVDPEPADASSR